MRPGAARLSLVDDLTLVDDLESPAVQIGPAGTGRKVALFAGGCLTTIGLVLALFGLFIFVGSNLIAAKGQKQLLTSFNRSLEAPASTGLGLSGHPAAAKLVAGSPFGVLRIPALSLQVLLIEGTRPRDLEKGPGHLRGSALPGYKGNAVLAGRRATFGSAFRRLNDLARGDRIVVSTPSGVSTYVVSGKKIVQPGNPDVVGRTSDNRLTLVTSHPAFIANKRLAVTATLRGNARSSPIDPGPTIVGKEESGLSGDTAALGPLVLWADLLLFAVAGVWFARRRWPGRAIYLASTPVVLAMLYILFVEAGRLLPGTV